MTLLAFHDELIFDPTEPTPSAPGRRLRPARPFIIGSKISPPDLRRTLGRPAVDRLLADSIENYPATLICGRAGTGKTTALMALTRKLPHFAWYTLDGSDTDIAVFTAHLSASLQMEPPGEPTGRTGIYQAIGQLLAYAGEGPAKSRVLIFDDLHHVFDAPWFADLFDALIDSRNENIRFVFSARSKPPVPLWRLRSKQILNVIDETTLLAASRVG